ncbi:bifunctional 4-hydroxy-2-oxoglutarate aldolase/2-dehydro-3-deoxy-phosphogluconate aldolase [Paenibacillus sp. GXUN7292]|uniref:bifunctional 4-hydroxy-2-oxoglutarate aldolase/2-dehydro-3-deoxy-phosphogluconate aldolase n=1 Tax=Paenibacillus sp. GXUN7292 TaxID=3422499 RepID=UPI003D7EF71E
MSKLTIEQLKEYQIVAIVRGVPFGQIKEVFEALYLGGIRIAEITLNTDQALEAIRCMREQYGNRMWVGAGSVLNQDMAGEAIEAGAQFLVSPNVDEGMIRYSISRGIMPLPGVMTPTEIVQAVRFGASLVKVFPCTSLGVGYIKELQGPLSHIPMLAVGGIGVDNITAYKKAGAIGAGVGGSLINKEWVRKHEYEKLTDYALQLIQQLREIS